MPMHERDKIGTRVCYCGKAFELDKGGHVKWDNVVELAGWYTIERRYHLRHPRRHQKVEVTVLRGPFHSHAIIGDSGTMFALKGPLLRIVQVADQMVNGRTVEQHYIEAVRHDIDNVIGRYEIRHHK